MSATAHRPLPYRLLPVLRAENAQVLIHPDDRRLGMLLVGSQGSGKTAALLRCYLNDIRDERAAPIVIDPKSELARLCLRLTPPDCGKRVWFLDLGHPAFGMSPLRAPRRRAAGDRGRRGRRQRRRRAAGHQRQPDLPVLAPLPLPRRHRRDRPRHPPGPPPAPGGRLHAAAPGQGRLPRHRRARPAPTSPTSTRPPSSSAPSCPTTCAWPPAASPSASTPRATRSPASPASRRCGASSTTPPTSPLREIIEARDILIVDANMGAIGAENSKACMHFLLRMLHTQLQRQVHRPEAERPRVPLIVDEAHYVAGAENVVDQIATHRAAGLETAFGLQYFAQLGSGSEHEEKIRKGVLNLLQSRFLFRVGDARDAEEATRIAMSVYATMIRDDPDSRARLRVTPEQALQLPQLPLPGLLDRRRQPHPQLHGPDLPVARRSATSGNATTSTRWPNASARTPTSSPRRSTAPRRPRDADDAPRPPTARRRPTRPTAAEAARPRDAEARRRRQRRADAAARSPRAAQPRRRGDRTASVRFTSTSSRPRRRRTCAARARAGSSAARSPTRRPRPPTSPAPDSLRELAFLDRINEICEAQHEAARRAPPAPLRRRLRDPRAARPRRPRPARADRPRRPARPRAQRRRRAPDQALPRRPDRPPHRRPAPTRAQRRQAAAAVLAHPPRPRGRPGPPPRPAISPRREWRALEQHRAARLGHDLHALGWAIALHRTVGAIATDNWRTPRYATGRYPVPQLGSGQRRHPITLNEIPVPDGQAIIDVAQKPFTEIKPDLSLELRVDALKLTFDLLVELDLTGRPSYNREKFLAYDAFLTGWCLAHPRYRAQGTRPIVVFVCRDARATLACAREADDVLTGRIGVMGSPPSTGTTPAATTSSSPRKPTSTTAASTRSRCRRSRPGCGTRLSRRAGPQLSRVALSATVVEAAQANDLRRLRLRTTQLRDDLRCDSAGVRRENRLQIGTFGARSASLSRHLFTRPQGAAAGRTSRDGRLRRRADGTRADVTRGFWLVGADGLKPYRRREADPCPS